MNGTKGPQRRGPRLGRPGKGDPQRVSRRTPGNGPGPRGGGEALVAARVLVDETPAVAAEWRELCRWDPELAPDIEPPPAEPVIAAVAEALLRPQPLAWGADEEIAEAVDAFTDRA